MEFYTGSDCSSGQLTGEVVASGYAPPLEDNGPLKAVDGNTSTVWLSQCCPVDDFSRPVGFEATEFQVGCNVSDAWVGLDLGAGTTVPHVRCVRIFQAGFELMQTTSAWVSRWNGSSWAHEWHMDGLGGLDWNRRPTAPNTMWRLLYLSRKDRACPNQLLRISERPWGVANLAFFKDDECREKLLGGQPITSHLQFNRKP